MNNAQQRITKTWEFVYLLPFKLKVQIYFNIDQLYCIPILRTKPLRNYKTTFDLRTLIEPCLWSNKIPMFSAYDLTNNFIHESIYYHVGLFQLQVVHSYMFHYIKFVHCIELEIQNRIYLCSFRC